MTDNQTTKTLIFMCEKMIPNHQTIEFYVAHSAARK
jgi:hypothetical protein